MKIIVQSGVLLKALSSSIVAVRDNAIVPAVSNFLFELEGTTLRITGTDMSNTIQVSITVESTGSCVIIVPARPLYEIIKSLPSQTIEVTVNKTSIEIKSLSGYYTLATEQDTIFPKLKIEAATNSFNLDAELLLKAINHTSLTMPKEGILLSYEGLYIHTVDKKLTFVSTNANSIAVFTITKPLDTDVKIILQIRSIGMLKSILANKKEITVRMSHNGVFFEADNITFSCLLKIDSYANYQSVILQKFNVNALVDKDLFSSSLKRVSVLATDDSDKTMLDFADILKISYQDKFMTRNASETLPLIELSKDFSIGTNGRQLSQYMALFDTDTLRMCFTSNQGLYYIEDKEQQEDYHARMYSMPMR